MPERPKHSQGVGASSSADNILLGKQPDGPILSTIESMLERLGEGDSDKVIPITVFGLTLKFRYPKNTGEIQALQPGGMEFIIRCKEMIANLRAGKTPESPVYAKALSIREFDDDDLATAYGLHYWSSTDPDVHISEVQALTMVGLNPTVAYRILATVDSEHRAHTLFISFGGVTEKKTESPTITTNE